MFTLAPQQKRGALGRTHGNHRMPGYAFTSREAQVLSIATGDSTSGQQDTFLCLRGVDSHEHVWVPYPEGIAGAGHQLKDRGEHVNPASSVALGVPFARAQIDWSAATGSPSISLAALNDASATTAQTSQLHPSTRARTVVPLGHDTRPLVTVEFVLLPRTESLAHAAYNRLAWSSSVSWELGWRVTS